MAVENYFLSREGRILSTKILKFMRSLIIKMDTEANQEETKESYLKWLKYKYAYEGTDDIFSYDYTKEDCINAGLNGTIVDNKKILDREKAYKLQIIKDGDIDLLLKYLRKERIRTYVETNSYYSQFLGIPRPGQEIRVINKDKVNPEDPDLLDIQDIKIDKYPLTYEYVYIDGLIDKIRQENPSYHYLLFIENPKSIYQVRNTEQFDIIWCNSTLLNDTELNNFYSIYSRKKLYMQELMYVKGFNSRMDLYPFMMELLLLQDVFMSFFNSYMDNFALANYSDQEIFDILDSYNLSNLKKVRMPILRKIIRELPDLIELRGSDLIIEKLLDIVTDDSVTIKRYYLTKIHSTYANGETKYDTSKTYEDNADVIFKEKIIRNGNNIVNEGTVDYDSFVEDDDTWGGDLSEVSDDTKKEMKQRFKKELLQMDFSSILTKYLTISSTVNSYTKQVNVQNLLGLLWQWLRKDQENNFLVNDVIEFNSYTMRPIDMYAAICWLNQYLNGIPEPEKIRVNNMNIANIMVLRDTGIESLVKDIEGKTESGPLKIKLPAGLGDRTITEILGAHEDQGSNTNTDDVNWPYYRDGNEYKINYKNTLISFEKDITISELFSQYDKNIKIINALKEKWMKSSTLAEAKCWDYLIKQNQINTYFEIMFDDMSRFDYFIRENSREFYNYINISLNNTDEEVAYTLYIRLLEAFRDYMLEATENKISLPTPNSDEEDSSVEYLNDLKLLFNEFLSIYTELHKIEFSQVIDDSPYNRLKILYQYDKDIIFNSFNDKVPYIGELNKITKKNVNGVLKENKPIGYGNIVGDAVFYKYAFDLMKTQKLESRNSQISELENKISLIDSLLNNEIKDFERSNILSYINDELERINYIQSNSVGGLSDELINKKNIIEEMKEKLLDQNITLFYFDLFNISSGSYSGKDIIIEFTNSEINELKEELKEVNDRQDILPHFRTYIESSLLETYTDKIIFVKLVKSIGVDFFNPITRRYDGKMIYHHINSDEVSDLFNDKIRIDYNFTDVLNEDDINEKIKLLYNMVESDISYSIFVKEYNVILRYARQLDELEMVERNRMGKFKFIIDDDLNELVFTNKLSLKEKIYEDPNI
jgi:hypothetical protein